MYSNFRHFAGAKIDLFSEMEKFFNTFFSFSSKKRVFLLTFYEKLSTLPSISCFF